MDVQPPTHIPSEDTYPAEFVGIVFVVDQHGYSQFPPLSPCALTQ